MAYYHVRPHAMPVTNAAAKLHHRKYLDFWKFPIAELVPRIDDLDANRPRVYVGRAICTIRPFSCTR
jgi:hypothetical protein